MLGTTTPLHMLLILPCYIFSSLLSSLRPLWSSLLTHSGVLYRLIAEASTGAERDDNLEKAGEALKDALDLRIEMTGVCVCLSLQLSESDSNSLYSCLKG